jgi:UDP-glucose 4-epimerase
MPNFKTVLLTGGLGFIGSHTLVEVLENTQLKCVVIDDMSNCFPDILPRVKQIVADKVSSEDFDKRVEFHQQDVRDPIGLDKIFESYKQKGEPIEAIIHFAGLKAVHESIEKPILYFETNVVGSMNMFKMMEKYDCKNFIFSSTSTVYGDKDNCQETDLKTPMTPYGESKTAVEMLMGSLAKRYPDWRLISLRYFNPCGAHKSGLIGHEPYIYPNNLFPFIQEVLCGKR